MQFEATEQHRWLRRLVGSWAFEASCVMEQGQEPVRSRGTERVRMLGDLWVVAEGSGEMPGCGMMQSVMTLGFDPSRGKFVGSWVGSPMPMMFVYEGSLDAAGRVLPLDTEGPHFADPAKRARYQDIIEIRSDDERTWRSQMLGDDGEWMQFMEAVYRRTE